MIDEEERKRINKEFARRGGLAVKEKYGSKHFSEISKRGKGKHVEKYGPDYYKKIRAIGIAKQKARREELEKSRALVTPVVKQDEDNPLASLMRKLTNK